MADKAIKHTGGTLSTMGIIQIIVGIVAILAPLAAGVTVIWIIGIILFLVGLVWMIAAFGAKSFGSGVGNFLAGLLYFVCGILVVLHPLAGLAFLALLLAIFFLFRGLTQLNTAYSIKPRRGWGWLLFGGILSVALGILLLVEWPGTSMWVIGVFVGLELLFSGWSLVFFGNALRNVVEATEES